MKLLSEFENLYGITEDGMLYSVRSEKFLKPTYDRYGYLYYVISIKGVRKTVKAHRLVAMAYIPNPENKPTVNHKNSIRDDNRVENLEWATWEEQQSSPITKARAIKSYAKTDFRAKGKMRNFGRVGVKAFKDGVLIGEHESLKAAAEAYGLQVSKISQVIHGKRKRTGGMTFEIT